MGAQPTSDASELDELVASRVRMQEVELRAVRLRGFLILATLLLVGYWLVLVFSLTGAGLIVKSLALLSLAFCWYLLEHLPHSSLSSWIFSLSSLGVVASAGMLDGQVFSGALFLLPVPVTASAFLLGRRGVLVIGSLAICVVLSSWWAYHHVPIPKLYPDHFTDRFIFRAAVLGMLSGMAVIATRIAQRSQARIKAKSEVLLAAKTEAEDAKRTKQVFLANMSHEIRTPLHGILGLSAQLERPGRPPRDASAIATMRESAEQLLKLLNDVLDLSKLEAGKVQLQKENFCLNDLLSSLAQTYAPKVEQGAGRWSFKPLAEEVWLFGDRGKLFQVLDNLLDNALEHGKARHVGLGCKAQRVDEDHLEIVFEIEDDGQGLEPALLERLQRRFDPTRIDVEASVGDDETLGLGFVLCDYLLRMMNGSMVLRSALGQGSCFRVKLKLLRGEAQARGQETQVNLAGLKVLVVDDGQINQRIAKTHLTKMEIRTELASSGAEAIEKCKRKTFDLVMLDLRMPGLDGVETAKALRKIRGYATVPMIASTADMDETWERRCKDVGINEYLIKPFHPDSLRACLSKSLIPRGSAHAPVVGHHKHSSGF